jgi:hypothetical protein
MHVRGMTNCSTRVQFLTLASAIANAVGCFALAVPGALLETKGAAANPIAMIWVREVGVLLIALGITAFLVRRHEDSATLRTFFLGNALLHVGLFPIEILGVADGVLRKASGVVPNSILHVAMASAFLYFARRMRYERA